MMRPSAVYSGTFACAPDACGALKRISSEQGMSSGRAKAANAEGSTEERVQASKLRAIAYRLLDGSAVAFLRQKHAAFLLHQGVRRRIRNVHQANRLRKERFADIHEAAV